MKKAKISNLKLDDQNINQHTQFGMQLLEKSITEVGFTEAIVISDDDTVISGNARTEVAADRGFDECILVETDGTQPIVIKRTDIKKGSEQFAKAKILANTVAKHNYIEDAQIAEAFCEEYNLDGNALGMKIQSADDIENVDSFTESVNFIIKCATLEDLNILQQKLGVDASKISSERFYEVLDQLK